MPIHPSAFRDLVSGRRRGPGAALLRLGLGLVEPVYTLAVAWRNRRYDRGTAAVARLPAVVVSVGNLTLGGTGKTPLVQWLARWLTVRGVRVALVSRGYGRTRSAAGLAGRDAAGSNDEALELAQNLPGVPHLQDPDRVAAARRAIAEFDARAIVLDDAFQHRRIARDLDIVLLDALEPFGFGHVFPRGTLREPVAGLRRAHVVVLSRADVLAPDKREAIRSEALGWAPHAVWAEAAHAPQAILAADGGRRPPASLGAGPVAAFCGIGNPAGFRHTLAACGYQVAALREFPDHHRYSAADRQSLEAWAAGLDVAAIVCTHKDLVKLPLLRLGSRPLWAVSIGLEFLAGQAELEARLAGLGL